MVSVEAQVNGLRCVFSDSIDRKTDHNESVTFIPLGCGANNWADKMLSLSSSRISFNKKVFDDYDIKNVVSELNEMYCSIFYKTREKALE